MRAVGLGQSVRRPRSRPAGPASRAAPPPVRSRSAGPTAARAPAGSSPANSPSARSRTAARASRSGATDRVVQRLGKGRIVPALARHAVAQDRLLRQQREHLAGHEGLETDHLTRADPRPFGMGAGQAQHAVEIGIRRQNPGNLGFLAAHHIGRAGLFQAGHEAAPTGARRCVGTEPCCPERSAHRAPSDRAPRASPAGCPPCRRRRPGLHARRASQRAPPSAAARVRTRRATACPCRRPTRPRPAPCRPPWPRRADAWCPSRRRSNWDMRGLRSPRHHHAAVDHQRLPGHHP